MDARKLGHDTIGNDSFINEQSIICTVKVSKYDMGALIRIRNYFGQNDKTELEHLAYDVLNRVVSPFLENKQK
jgi:hypothetical protein